MSVLVFYYCLCAFLCGCRCFNPSLCHLSPFLLSYVAVSRSCQCRYFTIVFVLFSVTVAVLTHLCVICRHFCSPMLLFQGHVSVAILLLSLCFQPIFVSFLAISAVLRFCFKAMLFVGILPQHGPHYCKKCISVAFLGVRERNFSHGNYTFIDPHLYQPNKIVGNQTKVKYNLLFQYISYCKTRLHGPSKAASLS